MSQQVRVQKSICFKTGEKFYPVGTSNICCVQVLLFLSPWWAGRRPWHTHPLSYPVPLCKQTRVQKALLFPAHHSQLDQPTWRCDLSSHPPSSPSNTNCPNVHKQHPPPPPTPHVHSLQYQSSKRWSWLLSEQEKEEPNTTTNSTLVTEIQLCTYQSLSLNFPGTISVAVTGVGGGLTFSFTPLAAPARDMVIYFSKSIKHC